jgi:hypothetical protein
MPARAAQIARALVLGAFTLLLYGALCHPAVGAESSPLSERTHAPHSLGAAALPPSVATRLSPSLTSGFVALRHQLTWPVPSLAPAQARGPPPLQLG